MDLGWRGSSWWSGAMGRRDVKGLVRHARQDIHFVPINITTAGDLALSSTIPSGLPSQLLVQRHCTSNFCFCHPPYLVTLKVPLCPSLSIMSSHLTTCRHQLHAFAKTRTHPIFIPILEISTMSLARASMANFEASGPDGFFDRERERLIDEISSVCANATRV